MQGDCLQCRRLSENLAGATQAYFAILGKSQLSQGENSSDLEAAAERRREARQELRRHEATHLKENGPTAPKQ